MSTAATRAPARLALSWAWLRALAARPAGYVVLGLLVAVTLAIGSVHRAAPSEASRITALESVIKCPSCTDESIAQSDATTAVGLRQLVSADVHEGWSDAEVLAQVRAKYGSGDLLVPSGSGAWLAWTIPLVALALGGGGLAVVLLRRGRRGPRPGEVLGSDDDEALLAEARRELRWGR